MTRTDHSWNLPPPNLTLTDNEVHVFRASHKSLVSSVEDLRRTLTADELERAERFRFAEDRQEFIVARGLLRTILSRYLDSIPEKLRFRYDNFGKPDLVSENGWPKLSFNLSHSGELVLYAIANGRKVGIDVEYIRADIEYDQIAAHFFSPKESSALQNLPTHIQPEAFFNCWTRKEAYIKARGEGLSLPLDQFDVSLVPGEPAALLRARGNPAEALRWSLINLKPKPSYAAAIAVEGKDLFISCWQWAD